MGVAESIGNGLDAVRSFNVSLPGLECDVARELIESGHRTCPYSKAKRGNIDVLINLIKTDSAPLISVCIRTPRVTVTVFRSTWPLARRSKAEIDGSPKGA
jgi:hypothetical protein